jgi:hypothetical protein
VVNRISCGSGYVPNRGLRTLNGKAGLDLVLLELFLPLYLLQGGAVRAFVHEVPLLTAPKAPGCSLAILLGLVVSQLDGFILALVGE